MSLQSYDLLKVCQNNRKQKDKFPLFGSIFKSIFANSDSFCLIIPHMSSRKLVKENASKKHTSTCLLVFIECITLLAFTIVAIGSVNTIKFTLIGDESFTFINTCKKKQKYEEFTDCNKKKLFIQKIVFLKTFSG